MFFVKQLQNAADNINRDHIKLLLQYFSNVKLNCSKFSFEKRQQSQVIRLTAVMEPALCRFLNKKSIFAYHTVIPHLATLLHDKPFD